MGPKSTKAGVATRQLVWEMPLRGSVTVGLAGLFTVSFSSPVKEPAAGGRKATMALKAVS